MHGIALFHISIQRHFLKNQKRVRGDIQIHWLQLMQSTPKEMGGGGEIVKPC